LKFAAPDNRRYRRDAGIRGETNTFSRNISDPLFVPRKQNLDESCFVTRTALFLI
jgi:hypothetical protein